MSKMMVPVKRIIAAFASLLIGFQLLTISVNASDVPYRTFTSGGEDMLDLHRTQTAYLPYRTIPRFGDEALSGPDDMFVTDDGEIYIADTGNSRIVVGDIEGNLIKIIGEGILETPRGVFVTANKDIYVADRDRNMIFVFDAGGNLTAQYGKPNSPLYGETLHFMPLKIVVNNAGIIFAICESNTNGIAMISPSEGGVFLGYFGANKADNDIFTIILRAIATDAQRAKMVSNFPPTPDNMGIDEYGLIYTVTRGEGMDTLKRLNIAGRNVYNAEVYDFIPAAVTAGNYDNVYMVSRQGYIYELNSEGELIFIFGGADDGTQRVGLCTLASAIQVDPQNRLYILDQDKSQIQIYKPTEFTTLLHTALQMYAKGRYAESKEPLRQILSMNSMFDYANKAIGRAYFQEEDYEAARYHARLAKDKVGYSDAAWEIRNIWLKKNIVPIIWIGILLFLATKVLKYFDRKKKIFAPARKLKNQVSQIEFTKKMIYPWFFMRHPLDGSYGIARQGKASFFAANILVVIFTVFFIINKYLSGFLQKSVDEGRYEIVNDIGLVVITLLALTACNYLVCTINDGEGTIKKLYCAFTYCLTPYITFIPLIFVMSHILTDNEQFLIDFTYLLIYGWTAVLFFLAVKEINNYMSKETFKVLFLTLFTILILALLLFIIYVLWSQVFEFVAAIAREVVYRIG